MQSWPGACQVLLLRKSFSLHLCLNSALRDEQPRKSLGSTLNKNECVKLALLLEEDEEMDDDVKIAVALLTRIRDLHSDLSKKRVVRILTI